MANVFATKAGNWSDITVWNTGALPTSADDVFSNNFAVTINQNINVLSIRNTADTGITAGGNFTVSTPGLTIAANPIAGAVPCLIISAVGTTNVGANSTGGTASGAFGVNFSAATGSTLNYIGNSTGGSGTTSHGLNIAIAGNVVNFTGIASAGISTGTGINNALNSALNVTGNAIGGSVTGGNGISNVSTGTVNITGNVIGGSVLAAYGVNNIALGTVIVNGQAIGGTVGPGANNASTGTLRVTTAVSHATNNVPGVAGVNSAGTTVVTNMIFGSLGQIPISGFVKFDNGITNTVTVTKENASTVVLIDAANLANELPAIGNVRAGTVYNSGNRIGTLAVPNPANVRRGIATDNTLGTADLTAADMWGASLASLTEGIGARLKDVSTVQTTGDQLAAAL